MPLKGYKPSAETIAKRAATRKRNLKLKAGGHVPGTAVLAAHAFNSKDAAVYLRHAIAKWPMEKGKTRGIAKLYVELALATLEGRA
jgi:hypothetical protein